MSTPLPVIIFILCYYPKSEEIACVAFMGNDTSLLLKQIIMPLNRVWNLHHHVLHRNVFMFLIRYWIKMDGNVER
jgi:hypothetical protein